MLCVESGLLDEAMLKRCMKVCKHWKHLAGETMEEIRFRKLYQEQVEAMMNVSAAAWQMIMVVGAVVLTRVCFFF